jgi:hypothetical protein
MSSAHYFGFGFEQHRRRLHDGDVDLRRRENLGVM